MCLRLWGKRPRSKYRVDFRATDIYLSYTFVYRYVNRCQILIKPSMPWRFVLFGMASRTPDNSRHRTRHLAPWPDTDATRFRTL